MITITNVVLSANVVTITTSTAHGITAVYNGRPTVIGIYGLSGGNFDLNSVWALSAVPSTTTLQFAYTHANISTNVDSGTVILYSGQALRAPQLKDATAISVAARFVVDDPAKAGAEAVSLALFQSLLTSDISNTLHGFTKQQYFAEVALTDAATITWDADTQQAARVTLGGNRTLALPSNLRQGASYVLRVLQDGTGSRTLAFASGYKWATGSSHVVSTAPNSLDIFCFISDGTSMFGGDILKGVS